MTTKSDWERAYQEILDRARDRVGEPPTPQQLVAYHEGRLSPDEEERIRELLAYYPALAEALQDDDGDDEPPLLTNEELEADWRSLQRKMKPAPPVRVFAAPAVRRWQLATAASFAAAMVLGALYLRSVDTIGSLRAKIQEPGSNVEHLLILEGVSRGPASAKPVRLVSSTTRIVISLALDEEVTAREFHVALINLDATPPRTLWQAPIVRGDDGTFSFEVPRSFLRAQTYGVRLYGDDAQRPIASYAFWLSPNNR